MTTRSQGPTAPFRQLLAEAITTITLAGATITALVTATITPLAGATITTLVTATITPLAGATITTLVTAITTTLVAATITTTTGSPRHLFPSRSA
jgi:hypothetical protein